MTIIFAVLTVAMVAIAVYTDVRMGKIYNGLTAPCAALGLVLNAVGGGIGSGFGGVLDGVTHSLLGIAVGTALFAISSIFGRILGGGDVKLLMAVGAIQGAQFLLWTIVAMAIIGGILAVGLSLWQRSLSTTLKRMVASVTMRLFAGVPADVADATPTGRLPYAIPIALGSLVSLYVSLYGLEFK